MLSASTIFIHIGHKAKEECMFCHGRILKLWVPQYFNGQTLPNQAGICNHSETEKYFKLFFLLVIYNLF